MSARTEVTGSELVAPIIKGDQKVASAAFRAYYPRMLRVVRRELADFSERKSVARDLVVDAFQWVIVRLRRHQLTVVFDNETFVQALEMVCRREAASYLKGASQKRDDIMTFTDSSTTNSDLERRYVTHDEHKSENEELIASLMKQLRDDEIRTVAQMRLDGATEAEIHQKVGLSIRSVRRKLRIIERVWGSVLGVEKEARRFENGS